MKTYIDLNKGIAFGSGKAWEFKKTSQSSRTGGEVYTSLPSPSLPYSRQHSSLLNTPTIIVAENPNRNLLHQCCDELGVVFLGN